MTGGTSERTTVDDEPVLRAQRLVALLGLITGVALFFVGGVDDPLRWAVFAGLAAVAWPSIGKVVRRPIERPGAPATEAPRTPSGQNFPTLRPTDSVKGTGPDDVDYLRALRHEFRTPLNAVLGFSDVLLSGIDGDVNESQREDLEIIRASGIRLRVLLDSALDISQLADGELRLDVDQVDVRALVGRAAVEAGQLWSNKREARCELPEGPCVADVDEARLRRSILVLVDFLATHHRDASISMSLRPSADHLGIELTAEATERPSLDALPSPEEVLAAEDASTIRQWPVAVTSELVGLHGGSLYHGSTPARFRIRLPLTGAA
jgi:signal transduction histidine kinase